MKVLDIGECYRVYGGALKVAEEMGVSRSAIYLWQKKNSLPHDRAEEFAQALGVEKWRLHDPWGDLPRMSAQETRAYVMDVNRASDDGDFEGMI